ncbi:hypothetical protein EVAR_103252_1 [Eumeta japonica]|uniref:Uncharacterized protein n=1 Tax=Eumeta variegata TaxID=151549 RepID=A0A4C2A527_EUMVA|nr:hypothetical protein EVAR_103252_1 [Eumeta japonica]
MLRTERRPFSDKRPSFEPEGIGFRIRNTSVLIDDSLTRAKLSYQFCASESTCTHAKSMTHCHVPPEPSVRARARNKQAEKHDRSKRSVCDASISFTPSADASE